MTSESTALLKNALNPLARAPGGKLTRPPFQKFAPAQGRGTYGLPTTTFR